MGFRKIIFKMEPHDAYIREYMEGVNDPAINEFGMLSLASIMKPEYQKAHATKEYIDSYVISAKTLAAFDFASKWYPIKRIDSPYAIPCLFLCRQAVELAIKEYIEKSGNSYEHIHSIKKLWEALKEAYNLKEDNPDTCKVITQMNEFIDVIYSFDNENSTKLRYPTDKTGNISQKEHQWVFLYNISYTTELFVKQLDLLEADTKELTP